MVTHNKVKIAICLLILVILGGTIGFILLEGWPFLDALFMTVITLSTVGFREVHQLSSAGCIFTILLIISGLGVFIFSLTVISTFILEGHFSGLVRRRRMERKIQGMNNHFIICGKGETGTRIIKEFQRTQVPFVVIEKDREEIEKLEVSPKLMFVEGDATEDEVLFKAGIKRAQGIVTALPLDTDNLFVVISARHINPRLRIVARATDETAFYKMKTAGANNVISPNTIGGLRMASIMLRPTVVDFLDVMSRGGGDVSLRLEEALIPAGSHLDKKTLIEAKIPQKTGLMIIAIKKKGESAFLYNPTFTAVLSVGDILIVLGSLDQVDSLHRYLETPHLSVNPQRNFGAK